jgi:hypothetical protein
MELSDKIEKIEWNDLPNAKIKENLLQLKHRQESLKVKLNSLIDILEELEKEYNRGDEVLIKRMKGIY